MRISNMTVHIHMCICMYSSGSITIHAHVYIHMIYIAHLHVTSVNTPSRILCHGETQGFYHFAGFGAAASKGIAVGGFNHNTVTL